ncbi:LUC7 N-terminus domain-containing protein [Ditylenchus destructor]|uniref:LUC7 N-terminus domain-containing protein n=1 Tax=Ditylenchus destructor TaxID=166010 RepID=A0AAD4R8K9_9BILA|nr:LUC7 N-terminus domain-containing protein [Ditylenchus destructor]
MSAREQIAMMLNELMGPSRNNDVDRNALRYEDTEVCKFFLVSFCPHELFTNTKADLGPCPKYHDENLRIAYQKSEDFEKLGYERTFYRFLCKMYDEIQRKIQKNKERLALTQGHLMNIDEATRLRLTEKISNLEKEIAENLKEAERMGQLGQIEKSQKYAKRAEELRVEIEQSKSALVPDIPKINDPTAPKPMEVCEVCGCFLIIGDVQQRIEEHFTGKQHLGYAKIMETMNSLKERLRAIDAPSPDRYRRSPERRRRSVSSHRDRDDRDKERERKSSHKKSHHHDDDKRRSSKRSRSRSRDRSRERRHRHRSRSGSRKRSRH